MLFCLHLTCYLPDVANTEEPVVGEYPMQPPTLSQLQSISVNTIRYVTLKPQSTIK